MEEHQSSSLHNNNNSSSSSTIRFLGLLKQPDPDPNPFELDESDMIWSSSCDDDISESPTNKTTVMTTTNSSPSILNRHPFRHEKFGLSVALSSDTTNNRHPLIQGKRALNPSLSVTSAARTIPPLVPIPRSVSSNNSDGYYSGKFHQSAPVNVPIVQHELFELVAYYKGWHFSPPSMGRAEVVGLLELVYANWLYIRANYLAPPLQSLTNFCVVLFLIQSVDQIVLMLGCFWIKFRKLKPVPLVEFEEDVENENAEDYPMVLIQIPMCNEREVRRCRSQNPPAVTSFHM